jgi:outer membrane lipoprotein-sorting protein
MKLVVLVAAVTMLLLLAACRSETPGEAAPEPDIYQQIHQRLMELQTFRARASVEYISNKGSNIYETIQHSRITGEYRIEVTGPERVAGNVTSSDGRHIHQFSTRVNGRVTLLARENQERSEIFLTAFIRNWQSSESVSVSVTNMGEGQYTVLEATIPGGHPYLATQRLWVSNETLLPAKLVIFDPNGTERVIVTYHAFEYNVELDDSLFTV